MRPHEFCRASSLPDYECNHCGLPPEHHVHGRAYIDAFCKRCSQPFAAYLLLRPSKSIELHEEDCIGCEPPPVLWKVEITEVKPMEMPIFEIFKV